MSTLARRLEALSAEHRRALEWFDSRQGTLISWPAPLNDLFLINKAKGIHKPAGWKYALSVRQTLNSPYADKPPLPLAGGSWVYDYYQEGQSPADRDKHATNRGLMACRDDDVPVAVLLQEKAKPRAQYRVLGLARVVDWRAGHFSLQGYSPDGELPTYSANDVSIYPEPLSVPLVAVAEPGLPFNPEDARKRIEAQIVARQGGQTFRDVALKSFAGRCAISEWEVPAVLEAAHIVPYLGVHTNQADNCLLLRADLHTLFDRDLLRIEPATLRVRLSESLRGSPYVAYMDKPITLPEGVHSDTVRMRLHQRAEIYTRSSKIDGC